jgi:hypothetical protein
MKRIFIALMLLPLSSFAMEQPSKESAVVITVTRDGSADQKTEFLSYQKEKNVELVVFDREYKTTIKYTVNLALLGIQQGKAMVKYSVDASLDTEEQTVTRSGEISFARGHVGAKGTKVEQMIPVNVRHVQELKSPGKQTATLGLTIITAAIQGPQAKL